MWGIILSKENYFLENLVIISLDIIELRSISIIGAYWVSYKILTDFKSSKLMHFLPQLGSRLVTFFCEFWLLQNFLKNAITIRILRSCEPSIFPIKKNIGNIKCFGAIIFHQHMESMYRQKGLDFHRSLTHQVTTPDNLKEITKFYKLLNIKEVKKFI